MINQERIVPIQKMDLLTMFGTILNIAGDLAHQSYTTLNSTDVVGDFSVTEATGIYLANQPVKTLNFTSDVSTATVYFIAAYDYSGMTINDVVITPLGTVYPDGVTLHKAVLADSAVTVTAVSPVTGVEGE